MRYNVHVELGSVSTTFNIGNKINIQQSIIGVLSPGIVWTYFVIVIAIVIIMSLIIVWHWTKHGKGIVRKTGTEIIYIVITTALSIALFTSIATLAANL